MLSSAAHAFLGWPPLGASLRQAGVDGDLITALTIGWIFGSVAMLAFGLIVLRLGLQLWRGKEADSGAAQVIAACYVVFGLAAFFWTRFNPHFIGFVVIGIIVAIATVWPVRAQTHEAE